MSTNNSSDQTSPSILMPVITAFFTLLGVVSTPAVGWLTAKQTAASNLQSSCISRIDSRQAEFRSKGEVFMGSVGELIATYASDEPAQKPQEQVINITKLGYIFSTYAPPELGISTIHLTNALNALVIKSLNTKNPNTEKPQEDKASIVSREFDNWTKLYYNAAGEFDKKLQNCALNTSLVKS